MRFPSFLRPNFTDEASQTRLDRSSQDDTVGEISFPHDPAIFRGVHINSPVRHPAHDVPLPAFSNRVSSSSKLHELPPQEVIDAYRQRCSDDIKNELAQKVSVQQIISRFSPYDRDIAVEFRAQSHTYFDWLFRFSISHFLLVRHLQVFLILF